MVPRWYLCGNGKRPGRQRLAAAIEQLDVRAKTVDVEHPDSPGGELIVVVSIDDDGGVGLDPGLSRGAMSRFTVSTRSTCQSRLKAPGICALA
jgi:hypothetical protein